MTNRPLSVSIALLIIIINAVLWLAFSIIIAVNAHPAIPDLPLIKWIMAALALITATWLLGLFIFLGKRMKIAYYPAIAFLLLISLLTIFDDFGIIDLAVLILHIIPLILLIKDRTWYLQTNSEFIKT